MRWWEEKKHVLVREKTRIDNQFPNNDFSFEIKDGFIWITGTLLGFFEFVSSFSVNPQVVSN